MRPTAPTEPSDDDFPTPRGRRGCRERLALAVQGTAAAAIVLVLVLVVLLDLAATLAPHDTGLVVHDLREDAAGRTFQTRSVTWGDPE